MEFIVVVLVLDDILIYEYRDEDEKYQLRSPAYAGHLL